MAFNITAQLQLQGPANLRPVINNIQNALKNIQATVNVTINPNTVSGLNNLNKQLGQVQTSLNSLNAAGASANTGLNTAAAGFNNASKASANFSATAAKNSQEMKNIISSLNEGASAAENFGRAAGLAARRYTAFLVAGGAILEFVQGTKSAIKEAIEFEREIVRLGQVGAGTATQIKSIEAEVTRLSTSLGVNSKELIQSSVTLAQAGYNAEQTKKALDALAQSALSPSFGSMAETVEGAIAVMQQFKIQTDGLAGALGSINAVAAGFAVESKDLIDGIKRAGGAFRSTGGDLNEFLALMTSVRSTTRESAESIATGLRTIFARLQRQDTVDALESLGIQLRHTREEALALGNTDLERQFVGPYEAITRLNQALKEVPGTDPRYSQIIEQLGGYRQISRVIPLIQELTTAQKAYATAQFGGFSLQTAANQAQEATIVKLEKLRQQFLALFRTIEESEGFRTFLDISIKLAGALGQITEALTPLIPLLGTLAALKIGQSLTGFAAGISIGLQGGVQQSRGVIRRASGGVVPGSGNSDSVPAMLTPGEYVIRKSAVNAIGVDNLEAMNAGRYNTGGIVQRFARGGIVNRQQLEELRSAIVNQDPNADSIIANYTGITGGAELREFKKRFGGQEREFNTLSRGLSSQEIGGKKVPVLVTPFGTDKMGMLTIGNVADSGVKLVEGLTAKKEANFVAQKALDLAGVQNIRSGLTVHILAKGASKQFINDYENKINPALSTIFPAQSGVKVNLEGSAKKTVAGYLFEEFIGAASKTRAAGGEAGFEYPGNFNSDPKVNQVARYAYPAISPGELLDVKYVTNIRKTSQDIAKKYLNYSTANGTLFDALGLSRDAVRNNIVNKNTLRQRKAVGGSIDGGGEKVPALLTPGEYVMSKEAVQAHGIDKMHSLNAQRFAVGGPVKGKTFKVGFGTPIGMVARSGADDETELDVPYLDISRRGKAPKPIESFINNLRSNQIPEKDFNKYINIQGKVQRSVLNPDKSIQFEHDVTDVIHNGINQLIGDLPTLNGNYKPEITKQALSTIVGPAFELYISRLTGSKVEKAGENFDFPNVSPKRLAAFNKIFTPNVNARYIDAKSSSTASTTKDIVKKGLNQGLFTTGSFNVQKKNSGGLIQRFATGGRVLGPGFNAHEDYLRKNPVYNSRLIGRIKEFPDLAIEATTDPLADKTLRDIVAKARATTPVPFPNKDELLGLVKSKQISQAEADSILSRFDTMSRLIPVGAKNLSKVNVLPNKIKGEEGYYDTAKREIGATPSSLLNATFGHELVHSEQHATGRLDRYDDAIPFPSSDELRTRTGRENYFLHFSELEARLRQTNLYRAAKVIDRLKAAKKFAGGGGVGGSGSQDTVPAMLTPGEYVVNRDSVQKYGTKFFNEVNAKKFAAGGPITTTTTIGGIASAAANGTLPFDTKTLNNLYASLSSAAKSLNLLTDSTTEVALKIKGNSVKFLGFPAFDKQTAAALQPPVTPPAPPPALPAGTSTIEELIQARAERALASKKINGQISDRSREDAVADAQKEIYNQILQAKRKELSKTNDYSTLLGKAIGSVQNLIFGGERRRIAEETAAKAIQFSSTTTAQVANGQIKLNQATLQAAQAQAQVAKQAQAQAQNATTQSNASSPTDIGLGSGKKGFGRFSGGLYAASGVGALAASNIQNPLVSETLNVGSLGAGIGTAIAPGIGTIIGGLIGGLAGLTSALISSEKEIKNIKLANQLEDITKKLQHFGEGLNLNVATINTELKSRESSIIAKSIDDSTSTFGGFDRKKFDESSQRGIRETFGNLAPQLAQNLSKSAEEVGKAGQGQNIGQLIQSFRDANAGLNQSSIRILSKVEGISQDDVIDKFRKVLLSSQRGEGLRNQAARIVPENERLFQYFGRLSTSIEGAANSLNNLQESANTLESLYEGRLSGSFNNSLTSNKIGGSNVAEFRNALSSITNPFGEDGARLKDAALALDEVTRTLPIVLSDVLQNSGFNTQEPGTLVRDSLSKQLTGGSFGNVSGPLRNIIETIGLELNKIAGEPEKLQSAKGDVTKLSQQLLADFDPISRTTEKIAKDLEANANSFIGGLKTYQNLIAKTGQELDRISQLQLARAKNNAERQADKLGRRSDSSNLLSLTQLDQPFQARQERLVGVSGAQASNPDFIAARLQAVINAIPAAQAAQRAEGGRPGVATQEFIKLQDEASRLQQALKNLTEITDRNAGIQEKLNKIEEERQARLGFAEKYITAGSKDRGQINAGLGLVNVAAQPGFDIKKGVSDFQRKLLFDTLNSLKGITLNTSAGKIKADDLKTNLLEQTGIKLNKTQEKSKEDLEKAKSDNIDKAVKAQELLATNVLPNLQNLFFDNLKAQQNDFFSRLEVFMKAERTSKLTAERDRLSNDRDAAVDTLGRTSVLNEAGIGTKELAALRTTTGRQSLEGLATALKERQTNNNFVNSLLTEITPDTIKPALREGFVAGAANAGVSSVPGYLARRARGEAGIGSSEVVAPIVNFLSDRVNKNGNVLSQGQLAEFTQKRLREFEDKIATINAQKEAGQAYGQPFSPDDAEAAKKRAFAGITTGLRSDITHGISGRNTDINAKIATQREALKKVGFDDTSKLENTLLSKGIGSFTTALDALGNKSISDLQKTVDDLNAKIKVTNGLIDAVKASGTTTPTSSGAIAGSTTPTAVLNPTIPGARATTVLPPTTPATPSPAYPGADRRFTLPATDYTPATTITLPGLAPSTAIPASTINPLAPSAANINSRFGPAPVNPYAPSFGAAGTNLNVSPTSRPAVNPLLAVPSTATPVSVAPSASGSGIASALGGAATATTKLADTLGRIPNSIAFEGKHEVNVVVNGLEVLAQLTPEIQKLVGAESAKAIAKLIEQKMPDAGRVVS